MLRIYTLHEAEEWNRVVETFKEYDVYYLSGYARSLQVHGDGEPLLISYTSEQLRGIQVVIKRRINDDSRFAGKLEEELYDLITPYGYGGWLLDGDGDTDALMAAYDSWCLENRIVAEFVRFHPVLNNQEPVRKYYRVEGLGATIAMDLSSEQTIWDNLTSKNRNMVRKAQKNGLSVFRANSPEIYEQFRQIYNATMDKDHADDYYYFGDAYYQSLRQDLCGNAQVFYTQTEDGQVAAAAIMLGANGRLNYHLSGSRMELQRLAPTNLLLFEAARWGAENGYRTFHLGGGLGAREDSLLAFKKAFYRGEPCRYHIGKRIVDPDTYEMLLRLRGQSVEEGGFFPAYRK